MEALLDAEHPIMDRVQFALEKQLKGTYSISKLKLSEQCEELTRQKHDREEIGVQLYQE